MKAQKGGPIKKHVLIVEDELDMRIFLTTLLETSGYTPIVAKNGDEGIQKAKKNKPDLIVLDVMMPGKGGALMYSQLKQETTLTHIPVIILSAIARKTFFHYLNMLQAQIKTDMPLPDAYVEKPPEPGDLIKLIKKLVQGNC